MKPADTGENAYTVETHPPGRRDHPAMREKARSMRLRSCEWRLLLNMFPDMFGLGANLRDMKALLGVWAFLRCENTSGAHTSLRPRFNNPRLSELAILLRLHDDLPRLEQELRFIAEARRMIRPVRMSRSECPICVRLMSRPVSERTAGATDPGSEHTK
jgi:hypothetical protein